MRLLITPRFFLDHHANVQARNKLGETPLHLAAAEHEAVDKIDLLLERGAQLDAKTKVDRQPLHYTALEGIPESTQHLLERGAEVDARDCYGRTPLWLAMQRRQHSERFETLHRMHTILHLLDHGADVTSLDNAGQSIFDIDMITPKLNLVIFWLVCRATGYKVSISEESKWPWHVRLSATRLTAEQPMHLDPHAAYTGTRF